LKLINILIVEDKEKTLKQWEAAIVLFNLTNEGAEFNFYAEYAKSFSEAKGKIASFSFHVAVVDIRLSDDEYSNHENTEGNKVVREISKETICLIAIYSGQPKDVDLEDHAKKYIEVFEKGPVTPENILDSFVKKRELLESIFSTKKSFNNSMAELFYKSVWPRWEHWVDGVSDADVANGLKRHMATHLHASFLNEAKGVHPEEHYFVPSLTSILDTGDITFVDGKNYMLITPRCEIAQRKNKTYQFIELKDISKELEKLQSTIDGLNETKDTMDVTNVKAIEELDKGISGNESKKGNLFKHGGNKASLHFLPLIKQVEGKDVGPFHAQFDRLISIPKSEVKNFSDGVYASLSNEFVPSLIERLGNYFSRIGTPDYSHPENS
jgi:hypothetical protein